MRRAAVLLLALVALLGVLLAPPAAAEEEPGGVSKVTESVCKNTATRTTTGAIVKAGADLITGGDVCDKAGKKAEEKMEEWWQAVWDSVIGDILRSSIDATKWLLRTMLTLALMGPSLDLEDTGLFERDASLGGMLVWLGWVIAAFGAMWQIGKAAVTGEGKYWGEFLRGYALNAMLSGIGLTVVVSLLKLGDAISTGILKATFDDDKGIDRVIAVMVPTAVSNPVLVGALALVLLLVGFMQLVLIFLRQSAIPIQCLLLPVAGAGLMGGKATQSWAPKLITSICMVIAYKPILTVIICVGFAELDASSVVEWMRGLATLLLAVLAPGPLAKLFSPFGAELGGGMSAGGAMGGVLGMAAGAGGKAMGDSGSGGSGAGSGGESSSGGGGGGGEPDADPVGQARYVQQSMGPQSGGGGEAGGGASVPSQGAAPGPAPAAADGATGAAGAAGAAADAGMATGTTTAAAGTGAAAAVPGVGMALQVMDGVNDAVQSAASEIGDGGEAK
ncbi:hypothetical protein AMK21_30760 [Streptomyces sp. CB00316]|uniref:hypothetical protein n=1 Tax=Streptomyces sp. CB00316 TaxID=1703932 RepID=UPI00093AEC5F|nr:hypothetical protein [Streptomyces sp. CB00316]OKJ10642.1 hypothetical protein AMK21_30760 [Streptomyces sp. CB00316]